MCRCSDGKILLFADIVNPFLFEFHFITQDIIDEYTGHNPGHY